MNVFSIQSAKIGLMFSLFAIGATTVYISRMYSIQLTVVIGLALFLASVYEYRRKLADIRIGFKYENQ